ncbi:hypothetical protein [Amycolatopsis minnesotensis]|uniref:Uncharacterized protein n=1 Tax=Amycolatopsis minnesotensis TaxID=337894 RepID=A0ABP5E9J4_9PSEU
MSSHTGSAITAPRTRRPAPPGMASRYEAGASLQCLARRYRMSAKTVRAHLVATGIQIRPPGRPRRTVHPAASPAGSPTAVPTEQRPALATVHPLRPHPSSQHEDPESEPPWPSFDLDDLFTPAAPEPPTTATAGEPCIGFTTPQTVHRISDTPVTTRFGEYTAAFTRCALIGLVDAPIPTEAHACAECHQGAPTPGATDVDGLGGRTRG